MNAITTTATRLATARAAIAAGQCGWGHKPRPLALFMFRQQFGINPNAHSMTGFAWVSYCWRNGLGPAYKTFMKG